MTMVAVAMCGGPVVSAFFASPLPRRTAESHGEVADTLGSSREEAFHLVLEMAFYLLLIDSARMHHS